MDSVYYYYTRDLKYFSLESLNISGKDYHYTSSNDFRMLRLTSMSRYTLTIEIVLNYKECQLITEGNHLYILKVE